MLPDDVLLQIFYFFVDKTSEFPKNEIEKWQTLVHVCRRWRRVVFGSPRHLNLRLVCTPETPARETLDVWPSLPLLIRDSYYKTEDVDDIIAVLKRSDRVVKIRLYNVVVSGLENVLATMGVPFPELTRLSLSLQDGMVSVLPDSFLGGSAPRLESLSLIRIPFPGLPKLLLSATHLVELTLADIPHSGYISPEEMVTALSTLPRLDYLSLQFGSPQSRPDRHPPPLTRSVLHVLISFQFKGVCEYLEDIMARIDAPRLKILEITLFNQIIFDTPQFIQFISRTPMLERFEKALVVFGYDIARVILLSQTSGYGKLNVQIPCIELDWQVSSMEQICTSGLPPLSSLEDLYIYENRHSRQVWQDNIENALLLELLQPFTTVKNLYLSEKTASCIMPALQELVGGRTTEVLPILQNIFLEELQPSGTVQACIQQFIATRQVTSQPIAVSRWDNSKEDMNRMILYNDTHLVSNLIS
jgi:hypothetical protein